ncbi:MULTISPECIES: hypothetical protein [unclassified Phenylobacterium]|uniref:hypothetical protein n=1 Tax=unclassified Phenylobacterium TaxID=2640670 RepID=UPI00083B7E18|nr:MULTISPECIES: hypothetical protein [unclassified Phenylobacterium]
MKLSTLLSAAFAALTIITVTTAANAAPAATDGDYVTRTVRSANGKDNFVRIVKVPKAKAVAQSRDCPIPKDMCDRMMGDRHGAAPKG